MSTLAPLLLSFLAVAAPPPQGRDYESPPPGSREDQALWRTTQDANRDVLVRISAATRLQLRARTGAYVERLDALIASRPDSAERAKRSKGRLVRAWNDSVDLVTRRWPIDPEHSCRYALLTLEGVMFSNEGPAKSVQLSQARFEVQQCLGKVLPALRNLEQSNRELEKVLSDLDRELGPPAPLERAPRAVAPAVQRGAPPATVAR